MRLLRERFDKINFSGRIKWCQFLLLPMYLFSCSGGSERLSEPLVISPNPVFSETDSFMTSTGYKILSRDDYFIVKGDINDTVALKKAIDSFVHVKAPLQTPHYNDYLMDFYRESDAINERAINNEPMKYRYKTFLLNKENDYLAGYTFKHSRLDGIVWGTPK
jgi:hypothetical protein